MLALSGGGRMRHVRSARPRELSVPVVLRWQSLTTLDLVAGQPGGPGWVDGPLAVAPLADPGAMTGDTSGHLYVIDGNTVRVVDTAAGLVTTLAGAYAQVGSADGTGPAARFNQPSGLALLGPELVLTDTENSDVRQIDLSSGAVTTIAGAAGQEGTTDAVGTDARFDQPEGLAFDGAGTLYIADTGNDTVRSYALDGGATATVAGVPSLGGAVDGVGSAAEFHLPRAMVMGPSGVLSIADSVNQSVRTLDPTTGTVGTLATFGAPRHGPVPQGVALDGADVLVALAGAEPADNRVVRVSADGTVTTIAGSATARGYVDGPGSVALFDGPAGPWNDGAGTLYVADERNAVVRAVDLATSTVTTYVGAQSAGSRDGTGLAARFSGPAGVASDDTTAYVADTGNATIRKVVLATGEVTTLAGAAGDAGLSWTGPRASRASIVPRVRGHRRLRGAALRRRHREPEDPRAGRSRGRHGLDARGSRRAGRSVHQLRRAFGPRARAGAASSSPTTPTTSSSRSTSPRAPHRRSRARTASRAARTASARRPASTGRSASRATAMVIPTSATISTTPFARSTSPRGASRRSPASPSGPGASTASARRPSSIFRSASRPTATATSSSRTSRTTA